MNSETTNATSITVEVTVNVPVEKAWKDFTDPSSITGWYFAGEDWHAPAAENDLKTGGNFKTRMEARDGSMGFDFEGTYTKIEPNKMIAFIMPDNRKVSVLFRSEGDKTVITETFDAETANPIELQQAGWQAILENFKKFTEGN